MKLKKKDGNSMFIKPIIIIMVFFKESCPDGVKKQIAKLIDRYVFIVLVTDVFYNNLDLKVCFVILSGSCSEIYNVLWRKHWSASSYCPLISFTSKQTYLITKNAFNNYYCILNNVLVKFLYYVYFTFFFFLVNFRNISRGF